MARVRLLDHVVNRWALLAAAVLVLAHGCGPGRDAPVEGSSSPSIVLITIDTLRADHLGCYGYFRDTSPNLDAFSKDSVFFERAYCPMATTLPSHVSMLTGLSPLEHGIHANQEHGGGIFRSGPGARSIAEFLRDEGYVTGAFVSATPLKRSSGIDAGFETFDEPSRAMRKAEETTAPALRWIERHAAKKLFCWIHYYDPHWPRRPPAPFVDRYRDEPGLDAFLRDRQIPDAVAAAPCKLATVTREATNAYDGAIRYVDQEVGRVFDALRAAGLWDRSVVIVTSDHGEGLNQHDWPAHGRTFEEQLHVPLMIRFPGARSDLPRRVTKLVSLVDLMPTVLGRLGVPVASGFERQASGVDALAPGFEERPLLAMRSARDCGGEGGAMLALTSPEWKYVHDPPAGDRLFHRSDDPFELRNVRDAQPTVADALRTRLLEIASRETKKGNDLAAQRGGEAHPLDPQVLEELESLGYVTGERTTSPSTGKTTPPRRDGPGSE